MVESTTRRRLSGAIVVVAALIALSGCGLTPGDPGPADVRFTIDAAPNSVRHPISPYIYGTNGARDIATNKQTVVRMGGNRWTAYNWENNASNAGSDWCFQNDGFLSSVQHPGRSGAPHASQAKGAGAVACHHPDRRLRGGRQERRLRRPQQRGQLPDHPLQPEQADQGVGAQPHPERHG